MDEEGIPTNIESSILNLDHIRGDVKMHWLHIQQPSAANLYRKSYIWLLNAAAFWLQPVVMTLNITPYTTVIRISDGCISTMDQKVILTPSGLNNFIIYKLTEI